MSQRLRGEALIVLLSRLLRVGAGTVFVLVTARHLGPGGRGEVAIAFTLAWATTSVADLGTSTSGRIGLLSRDWNVGVSDIVSLTLALLPFQVVLSTVAIMVLSATSMNLSPRFLVVVVVLSVATMMFHSAVSLLYGLRRYQEVLMTEVFLASFQIMAVAGLLVFGRLTPTSAVAMMAASSLSGALWLVRGSGIRGQEVSFWGIVHWRRLITSGLSPMVGALAEFFAVRMSRLVLVSVAGTRSLGVYTVALALPETLRILPRAAGQVIADRGRSHLVPVVTARRHIRLFVAGHGLVLVAALLVGWVLLPTVFGEGFTEARDVLVVVTVAEIMLSTYFMNQALLVGFGRPRAIGFPQVCGAVIMVVLNLVMIPRWGMHGAAWAGLFGYTVLAVSSAIWTNRELRMVRS